MSDDVGAADPTLLLTRFVLPQDGCAATTEEHNAPNNVEPSVLELSVYDDSAAAEKSPSVATAANASVSPSFDFEPRTPDSIVSSPPLEEAPSSPYSSPGLQLCGRLRLFATVVSDFERRRRDERIAVLDKNFTALEATLQHNADRADADRVSEDASAAVLHEGLGQFSKQAFGDSE